MDYDVEANSTTGVWIGADDVELFEEFDAYFQAHGQHSGEYSRGDRIKRAMSIYLVVHDAIREEGVLDHPDEYHSTELKSLVDSEIRYDDL